MTENTDARTDAPRSEFPSCGCFYPHLGDCPPKSATDSLVARADADALDALTRALDRPARVGDVPADDINASLAWRARS